MLFLLATTRGQTGGGNLDLFVTFCTGQVYVCKCFSIFSWINSQIPRSSVWFCFWAHQTQSLETQNSNQTSQLQFCIFGLSQSLCWRQNLWLTPKEYLQLGMSDLMHALFYLKSAFVTGYWSILNDCTLTSLGGNSPSFPSAALVPINILPPRISTISSAIRVK